MRNFGNAAGEVNGAAKVCSNMMWRAAKRTYPIQFNPNLLALLHHLHRRRNHRAHIRQITRQYQRVASLGYA